MNLELVVHQKRSVSPNVTIVKLSPSDLEIRDGKVPGTGFPVVENGCDGYSGL
jgi:hypothetical protein